MRIYWIILNLYYLRVSLGEGFLRIDAEFPLHRQ